MNIRPAVLPDTKIGAAAFEKAFQQVNFENAVVPLVAIDSHELIEREFPNRDPLLQPWLTEKTLCMVHAWRGLGKTHFALGVAYALAGGGTFLGWTAPKPRKVLYLDGEMAVQDMKSRIEEITRAADATPAKGYFRIVNPDLQDAPMPDLATREGQFAIDQMVEPDTALIIVDNLSCLVRRGGAENDAESWLTVSEWALKHRREGRSVLFIHHSGKGGAQRGTSKREDLLDVVINLRRPNSATAENGACFELHFEKARTFWGEEVAPFEARLTVDAKGKQTWAIRELENVTHERICELWELQLSVTDITHEVGRHKSNVTRALQKAQADGKLSRSYPAKGSK